jgi:hypothetical protein
VLVVVQYGVVFHFILSNTSGYVCSGVVINVQGSGGKWMVLEMKDNDVSQHRITIYFFHSCSSRGCFSLRYKLDMHVLERNMNEKNIW